MEVIQFDPDRPLAKAITVSLVLVSPSTYRKTVNELAKDKVETN